jgi:NTP pyrophosphatase (non-canonical NTP hydrolase)
MKIKDFQKRIKDNFFHKDSRRGGEKTYLWLIEEIGELSSAILHKNIENIGEELADVVAWTVSLANIYNIDLEAELEKKYPPFCKVCQSSPCKCSKKPVE